MIALNSYELIISPSNINRTYYHRIKFIELENKYKKLEISLQKQQWSQSDKLTFDILLKIVHQEQEFNQKEIQKIPCQDLQKLDSLWQKYSENRFGFSPQHQIWQKMGSIVSKDIDHRMADKMGWLYSKNTLYEYYSKTLNVSLESPVGHLPFMFYCCLNWDAHKGIWFQENRVVLSTLAQKYDRCLAQ